MRAYTLFKERIILPFVSSQFVSWPFRAKVLRLLGAQLGQQCMIGYSNDFAGPISNLHVGSNCYLNSHLYVQLSAPVYIGESVRIGSFTKIMTVWHPIEESTIRRAEGANFYKPCHIEDGCWIGLGVTILPGVTVAKGCVVAAGAVVTQSTTPNGLYAGMPAIRKRDLPTGPNTGHDAVQGVVQ